MKWSCIENKMKPSVRGKGKERRKKGQRAHKAEGVRTDMGMNHEVTQQNRTETESGI